MAGAATLTHISPFSGTWYPGEADRLEDLLSTLFAESEDRTGHWLAPNPVAFVVPHAGLAYSGSVAAAAYRHIAAAAPKRLVLLGFSHRLSRRGIFLPAVDAIRTPAGESLIDREAVAALLSTPGLSRCDESELCDHSVELQLPFLKRAVPEAAIVPVYVNRPDPAARAAAAQALRSLLSPGTVLLASSDLTHFGRSFGFQPFPVDSVVSERLAQLDSKVIDAAGSIDPDLFLQTIQATGATVCGIDPIALLLETLRGLDGPEIFQQRLDYRTSGELTGDFQHSVSYGALGYLPFHSFEVDQDCRLALLDSARRTLAVLQQTGAREPISAEGATGSGLDAHLGAFVTIYSHGELRGCVGFLKPDKPLRLTIPELTISAASADFRFPAITAADTGLSVEISILTPMKRVQGREAFRVNEHGAMLRLGSHQGLLLPQVASERGWDAETFFNALAMKSGLASPAYDDPESVLHVFRAQHF